MATIVIDAAEDGTFSVASIEARDVQDLMVNAENFPDVEAAMDAAQTMLGVSDDDMQMAEASEPIGTKNAESVQMKAMADSFNSSARKNSSTKMGARY